MRTLSARVAVLVSTLAFALPVRSRSEVRGDARGSAYRDVCGPVGRTDLRRRALLDAVLREIDAEVAASGSDAARARNEALGRRLDALRPPVEAVVRESTDRAIEIVLRADAGAPPGAASRLRAAAWPWIDPRDPPTEEARALERGCGRDLLADDAWVDKRASEVVLCPGLLLIAGAEGDVRAGLSFLVAHELGHVITGPHASGAQAEEGAERAADRWGARILASMIESVPSADERLRFVERALEPVCTPQGDQAHPPGADRVRAITRVMTAVARGARM